MYSWNAVNMRINNLNHISDECTVQWATCCHHFTVMLIISLFIKYIGIIWNNSLVRDALGIWFEPRTLSLPRSTAHSAQVLRPLGHMGRSRYWVVNRRFPRTPSVFGAIIGDDRIGVLRDLWHQQTRIPELSYSVGCMILWLAILIQYPLVTCRGSA